MNRFLSKQIPKNFKIRMYLISILNIKFSKLSELKPCLSFFYEFNLIISPAYQFAQWFDIGFKEMQEYIIKNLSLFI